MKVRFNKYVLQDPRISKDKVIASMSDTHGNIVALRYIMALLLYYKLDYILVPGDTLDTADQPNQEELIYILKKISENYKTVLSLGNHDLFEIEADAFGKSSFISSDKYKEFYEELEKQTNCIALTEDFESVDLDSDLSVNAINLPFSWYDARNHEDPVEFAKFLSKIVPNIDINKFNILLSHTPNPIIQNNKIISYSDIINSMNLILSGHNHGGLVPTPIQDIIGGHRGIIGSYARLLQPNAYGTWTDTDIDRSLIVSNGVTALSGSDPLRDALNKIYFPEVELIHMTPGDKHTLELVEREVKKL